VTGAQRVRALPLPRLALAGLIVVGVLLSGCASHGAAPKPSASPASPAIRQADELLDRYGLTPSGAWTWEHAKLEPEPFNFIRSASKSIGLDLRGYAGKQVVLLKVLLQGHSQAWNGREAPSPAPSPAQTTQADQQAESLRDRMGDINAWFVVDGDKVVGAYLVLVGYAPGIVSLKDRYEFMPADLAPQHLEFKGLKRVEVIGPWARGDWQESKRLSDGQTARLLSLIAASRLQQGERLGGPGDEEYAIIFTYNDGARVMAELMTKRKSGATFLSFDPGPFARYHYLPPDDFKPFVKSLLGVE
jgi:hypothetical protein